MMKSRTRVFIAKVEPHFVHTIDILGHHFTVLSIRDRRIRRLRGTPLPPEEEKATG